MCCDGHDCLQQNRGCAIIGTTPIALQKDVCQFLTFLLFRFICGIPERYQHGWFFVVGKGEERATQGCIEIANPTGCKPLLRGSQTQVFDGNGDVDVAMRFAIGSYPCLIVHDGGNDVKRCRIEPITGITLPQLPDSIRIGNDSEPPWLPVHRRRSHTHTLHDVIQFLLFYLPVLIVSATVPSFYQI